MSDFLDVKRREISDGLTELRPLVAEYHQLEAAPAALQSVDNGGSTNAATPRRRAATASGSLRRARRRATGTRAAEALALVQGQPGITIPELAERMGIKPNCLYRVLPGLEQDGQLRKEGRGWQPAERE